LLVAHLCVLYIYNASTNFKNNLIVILGYWLANLDFFAKDDPAKCPKNCGRSYKGIHRKKVLRRHLVYECGVERKFMCNICFRRFSQKYYLSTHLGTVHKV